MAQTLGATGPDAALSIDDAFLELWCADEDLMRAEFDAIIAAEWPTAPPPRRGAAHPTEPVADRVRGICRTPLPDRPRHLGVGGRARQRSPPAGCPARAQ
jgi:hypothetical protein